MRGNTMSSYLARWPDPHLAKVLAEYQARVTDKMLEQRQRISANAASSLPQ
jgi:hypothetical protein